jgi:aerobic carbon-monoxide dehydrogenase medium subunit
MIPAQLDYVSVSSVEEALEALAQPDTKALAGGQSLIPVLKLRIARPARVVDLARLRLDGIELRDGELRLGALETWDSLARADEVKRPGLGALADCTRVVGDLQVRNRGTVGGSLVHADPAADLPAVALALGARLVLRSATGEREVAADDFLSGPFMTAIAPDELVTEIVVPLPEEGAGSAYVKVEHPASGFALAGAAALVRADRSRSVAVTGVGARASLVANGDLAGLEVYGDPFAPEAYRRHLAGVVVERALALAEKRAGA